MGSIISASLGGEGAAIDAASGSEQVTGTPNDHKEVKVKVQVRDADRVHFAQVYRLPDEPELVFRVEEPRVKSCRVSNHSTARVKLGRLHFLQDHRVRDLRRSSPTWLVGSWLALIQGFG